MSLRQIAIGSAAMSSVTVLRMTAQLFVLPLLARYITPTEYGIIAIAMPFVVFAMLLSDAGVSSSLIRSAGDNLVEWSTSFWFIIGLGFCLASIIGLIGYIMSSLLSEPILFPIIAVLSVTIILQSITIVPNARMQYQNRFPVLASIEIVSTLFSLIATCLAAIYGWGAWALVAQQIVHYCIKTILTLFISGFRPSLTFVFSEIKRHVIFGRDLLGSYLIMFIRESARNIILAKVLGTHLVGIYQMSALFAELPMKVVTGPVQSVLYPRMSAQQENIEILRSFFLFVSRCIAIIVVPPMTMVAVAHEPIFRIVLSEKWTQSGVVFMFLAPSAIISCLTFLRNTVFMALGRTDILVRQSLEITVLILGALCIFVFHGIEAAALSVTLVNALYTPYILKKLFPLINLGFPAYLSVIYIPITTSLTCVFVYLFLIDFFALDAIYKFIVAIALGACAFGLSTATQYSAIMKEVNYLKQII